MRGEMRGGFWVSAPSAAQGAAYDGACDAGEGEPARKEPDNSHSTPVPDPSGYPVTSSLGQSCSQQREQQRQADAKCEQDADHLECVGHAECPRMSEASSTLPPVTATIWSAVFSEGARCPYIHLWTA